MSNAQTPSSGTTGDERAATHLDHMCPHCGHLDRDGMRAGGLTSVHDLDGARCPGSEQNPRNPLSDARLLWSGDSNPHLLPAPSTPVEGPQPDDLRALAEHWRSCSQSDRYTTEEALTYGRCATSLEFILTRPADPVDGAR